MLEELFAARRGGRGGGAARRGGRALPALPRHRSGATPSPPSTAPTACGPAAARREAAHDYHARASSSIPASSRPGSISPGLMASAGASTRRAGICSKAIALDATMPTRSSTSPARVRRRRLRRRGAVGALSRARRGFRMGARRGPRHAVRRSAVGADGGVLTMLDSKTIESKLARNSMPPLERNVQPDSGRLLVIFGTIRPTSISSWTAILTAGTGNTTVPSQPSSNGRNLPSCGRILTPGMKSRIQVRPSSKPKALGDRANHFSG